MWCNIRATHPVVDSSSGQTKIIRMLLPIEPCRAKPTKWVITSRYKNFTKAFQYTTLKYNCYSLKLQCRWIKCILNVLRRTPQKLHFPLGTKCTPKLGIFTLNRPKLTELCLPVPSVCTIFDPIFILGQWERDWHLKMKDNYIGQEKIFVFMS